MSWEFEQKFTRTVTFADPGSFDPGMKLFTGSQPYTDTAALWSGRDLWVFMSNARFFELAVFNVWDSGNTNYEKLTYHYYFDNGTFSLREVFRKSEVKDEQDENTGEWKGGIYHTTTSARISAAKWYDKIYSLHGTKDIFVWDIETKEFSPTPITLPSIEASTTFQQLTAKSNICAANNKLYIATNEQTSGEQQRLAIYDLATQQWTLVALPGRHQTQDRHIVDGNDGYVWVTSKNNHTIIKVSTTTNTVEATLRINRHPYRLSANQSKDLFVASDPGPDKVTRKYYEPGSSPGLIATTGGMIVASNAGWTPVDTEDPTDGQVSIVNQTTNGQSAYAAARCNGQLKDKDFYDDGQGFLWFVTDKHIGRLKKSDKEMKCSFTKTDSTAQGEPQYEMIPQNSEIVYPLNGTVYASVVSPRFGYQRWNGAAFEDVDVKPYLYAVTVSGTALTVNAVRLSALVRKNKYIHRTTAMIAVGQQAYYGD